MAYSIMSTPALVVDDKVKVTGRVHVFPNGNGRHARLMTDLLLIKNGEPKFTWGTNRVHSPLEVEGKTRTEYITALKKADLEDFAELIKFARS